MTEALEQAREVVRQHDNFLCVAHKDADADSLGSALAFASFLMSQGKRVFVWVPDPVPAQLDYLPGFHLVNRAEAPADAAAVAFDAGSPTRFGNLRDRIEAAPVTVVFDHHTSNTGFGDVAVIDREAAATGVIVYRALLAWGARVDDAAATNLYAAIFTDTGGFRHDNTSAEVLQLGADLARLGADPAWVALKSYKSRPETTLRLHALASVAARYELGGRLIWSEVTQAMLEESGARLEESEGIIDILQTLDTMQCAILFKEVGPDCTRVSVRTRGDLAAHQLVAEFGGGGHLRAAGAEVAAPLAEVQGWVLALVRSAIEADGIG